VVIHDQRPWGILAVRYFPVVESEPDDVVPVVFIRFVPTILSRLKKAVVSVEIRMF
jgi:hypothetical protein